MLGFPMNLQASLVSSAGAFLAISILCPSRALPQTFDSDAHTVRVSVLPISVVSLSSGTINLDMSLGLIVPGQDQMTVDDQSTTLTWGTNSSSSKITASTSLAAPLFDLRIVAVNPTQGTAGPEFSLTPAAQDLLLSLGRSSGSCLLRYTGVALASQGSGTDLHVITFTVQAQ